MHNWFTCKVTYEKVLENGMQKKVTELIWSMHSRLQKQKPGLLKKSGHLSVESLSFPESTEPTLAKYSCILKEINGIRYGSP